MSYYPFPDNSVIITILKPGVDYQSSMFKHNDALYYPSSELSFIATKRQSANYGENTFTELAIWHPEEIRLLGALTLSRLRGQWAPWFPVSLPNSSLDTDLSSDNVIANCVSVARDFLEKEGELPINYSFWEPKPPDKEIENKLFEEIDVTWGLLLRGLYTLMKSFLLFGYTSNLNYFMEEAFIDL